MVYCKRGVPQLAVILIVCVFLIWLFAGGWQSTQQAISFWIHSPRPIQSCPAATHPFQYSSVPPVPTHLQRYASRVFSNPGIIHYECERFTLIMMTYKRVAILPRVLHHYCKTPLLDKIIVIWNNVEEAVPHSLLKLNHSCAVPLLFIREKENRLTNRYKARTEIDTECVMTIDDDRIIAHDDLVFGFRVWQQFRQRIVGFKERTHRSMPDGTYRYGTTSTSHGVNPGYSMMISATFIMHRVYFEMFFDPEVLPRAMFEYVDSIKNCEDLGMCVMVTKFLEDVSWPQCGVLAVVPSVEIVNLEGQATQGYSGLSNRPDHYEQRSDCLNKFTEIYNGTLHLHYSHAMIYYS